MANNQEKKLKFGYFESLRPKVVVKFMPEAGVPYVEGAETQIDSPYFQRVWKRLSEMFPGITLKPKFTALEAEKIDALERKARSMDRTYKGGNLTSFFYIELDDESALKQAMEMLHSTQLFELIFPDEKPAPPPAVNAADDPRSVNQGYLDAAPAGIDARYAWTIALGGGVTADGTGIGFVDLERGWTLNHEDLTAAGITLISGLNQDFFGHGTAVLGQVRAQDNTLGVVGIAPRCTARVVSQWRTATTYNTADAVLSALAVMAYGDILLLEAQNGVGQPIETDLAAFAAIRLAVALGIVVVEAAGNGGVNLNTYSDASWGTFLNPTSGSFRDSGAIIVGASSSAAPHTRMGFSSFGGRVNCYGWGENIETTGDGWMGNVPTEYTSGFGGTSGASPMVAGAAILIQHIMQAVHGFRLSPRAMRNLLSDAAVNTQSNSPAVDLIGVMPNLRAIIDTRLNVGQDLVIRDFVGDTGDPHTAAGIASSPDIIVRTAAVANPQASFGAGSGTENNNALSNDVEAGQDNFVYVRVFNRGNTASTNVQAQVFWSPPATLVTPDLWNLVGSVNIPNVPTGSQLTASNAITWPLANIPSTGHYCFVALIGNVQDPAPQRSDFMNWNNFLTFIRNNNNVAWRNFNVVNNVPPPAAPRGMSMVDFMITGAPEEDLVFDLQFVGRLPEGSRMLLEAPYALADRLGLGHQEEVDYIDKKRKTLAFALQKGVQRFEQVYLPAKTRIKTRLHVFIPEEYRKKEYTVAVRQLYKGEEVGRITWVFSPKGREEGKSGKSSKY